MNLLLIDTDITGLDLALRAIIAGHSVRWWMPPNKDGAPHRHGDGFKGLEKVKDWRENMKWAKSGVIVNLFNDQKICKELDRWVAMGFPVFGPSSKSARMEEERGEGMKLMEKMGLDVPKYHTFQTLDQAIAFAWKCDEPYVFKVLGSEIDKSLSYVSSDPADMVGWLEMKKKNGLKLQGSCMMQEKIDMVCEVGVSAWMGKNGFLPGKFNVNFEFKKNLAGEFGKSVGEEGTVCKYVDGGRLPDLLSLFEDSFVKLGHIGDLDIGFGIDSKGNARPFEFSARFGWPSTPILLACHKGDPIEWMRDAVTTGADTLEVDDRVAMGVIMTRPPYPSVRDDDPRENVGYRIDGIEKVHHHFSPVQIMLEDGPSMKDGKIVTEPILKTTGAFIGVVTALGADVHDIIPEVYAAIDKIKYADRQVRNDVGKRLEHELPKLHAFGYEELPQW